MVERYVRDVEVACSNHVTPIVRNTTKFEDNRLCGIFLLVIFCRYPYNKKVIKLISMVGI